MINLDNEVPWRDMSTAPRDGCKLILIWVTPYNGTTKLNVREGYWEDFSYLPKDRREKLRPCWKYINDNDCINEVESPTGWLPCPNLVD